MVKDLPLPVSSLVARGGVVVVAVVARATSGLVVTGVGWVVTCEARGVVTEVELDDLGAAVLVLAILTLSPCIRSLVSEGMAADEDDLEGAAESITDRVAE